MLDDYQNVVKKMLEDYGKPGGAGDPTPKITDVVKKLMKDYTEPGGELDSSTKGVQAILDGYGITSLSIFQ